jgi:hypothetical protein
MIGESGAQEEMAISAPISTNHRSRPGVCGDTNRTTNYTTNRQTGNGVGR